MEPDKRTIRILKTIATGFNSAMYEGEEYEVERGRAAALIEAGIAEATTTEAAMSEAQPNRMLKRPQNRNRK